MADHETKEGAGSLSGGPQTVEEARRLHHLATADPEPQRDGPLTGPAHEKKYGLERAESSEALWRGQGVHPFENRALVDGEDGAENLRGVAAVETGEVGGAPETAAAPRASRK